MIDESPIGAHLDRLARGLCRDDQGLRRPTSAATVKASPQGRGGLARHAAFLKSILVGAEGSARRRLGTKDRFLAAAIRTAPFDRDRKPRRRLALRAVLGSPEAVVEDEIATLADEAPLRARGDGGGRRADARIFGEVRRRKSLQDEPLSRLDEIGKGSRGEGFEAFVQALVDGGSRARLAPLPSPC
jgi:hypothetical protein